MAILYPIFANLSSFQLHTFNSTRCIRNKLLARNTLLWHGLSTPHGALGTTILDFNLLFCFQLSTPHGALGTEKGMEERRRYEALSTPHGALGTPNDHIN
jgi:hypothetical protein